jgi:hypothetical protein
MGHLVFNLTKGKQFTCYGKKTLSPDARKLIILILIHLFLEKDATFILEHREYHVFLELSRKVLSKFIS